MITFDEQNLRERLGRLHPSSRVVFAACCAQRLEGAYEAYASRDVQMTVSPFRVALDYVWENVIKEPPIEKLNGLLAETLRHMPDETVLATQSHNSAYVSDALSALAYTLQCMISGRAEESALAARCAYETLDQFVINRDGLSLDTPNIEKEILRDPVIQVELHRQARDICELETIGVALTADLVNGLRRRSIAEQAVPMTNVHPRV